MKPKKILPPTLFWICLGLMFLLKFAWPVQTLWRGPFNLIGLLPLIAGFIVMISAWSLFRRARTNLNPFRSPDQFIQEGPFRFSRNPMYLGLALILAGVGMLLGALSPLVVVAGFAFLIDRWYIAFEEREMLARFGLEYEAYHARTRRWI